MQAGRACCNASCVCVRVRSSDRDGHYNGVPRLQSHPLRCVLVSHSTLYGPRRPAALATSQPPAASACRPIQPSVPPGLQIRRATNRRVARNFPSRKLRDRNSNGSSSRRLQFHPAAAPLGAARGARAPPRQRPAAPLPQAAARRLGLGRGGGGDQRVRPVLLQLHRVPLPARPVPQPPHHPHRGNLLVRPQAASRLLLPGDDRNGNFLTVSRVGARRPLGGVRR